MKRQEPEGEGARQVPGVNRLHEMHLAIDFIGLPAARRVLGMRDLGRARANFDWDLLSDLGVINLLRSEFLQLGDFERVFWRFQDSRRDRKAHRYESLLSLLVVTIVGSVISGIIVEHYKDLVPVLRKWSRTDHGLEDHPALSNLFDPSQDQSIANSLLTKFCSSDPVELASDLERVSRCMLARTMLDEGGIRFSEYLNLVHWLLAPNGKPPDEELGRTYASYEADAIRDKRMIQVARVVLAARTYAAGALEQALAEDGASPLVPGNGKSLGSFHGLPGASGFGTGVAVRLGDLPISERKPFILLVEDASRFTPDDIDAVDQARAVVTAGCGMTGHLPVICRGLGRACVILTAGDIALINSGIAAAVDGGSGTVVTGMFAEELQGGT